MRHNYHNYRPALDAAIRIRLQFRGLGRRGGDVDR